MKIITNDKSKLEITTIDPYTGDGNDNITILIYNNVCRESTHINLNENEVRNLRDKLNEWLDD